MLLMLCAAGVNATEPLIINSICDELTAGQEVAILVLGGGGSPPWHWRAS